MPASDRVHSPTGGDAPPRMPRATLATVALLLAAPIVGLLWVSSYDKEEPRLGGVPFFYWYQFLWVFIAAATTSLAYQIVVRHERQRRAHRDQHLAGHRSLDGGDAR